LAGTANWPAANRHSEVSQPRAGRSSTTSLAPRRKHPSARSRSSPPSCWWSSARSGCTIAPRAASNRSSWIS